MYLERKRKDDSFIAIGKLKTGRFLQIAYRKIESDLYFVITVYDILDNELIKIIEEHESNQ
jgi:hypothetical protein